MRSPAWAGIAAVLARAGLLACAGWLACAGLLAGTASAASAGARLTTAGPAAGPVPAGFQPLSMTFISASDGWVLGAAPCAHKPCTSVVRTTDGGRTWRGIPAPRFPLARFRSGRGLDRIRFADRLDGFAYGSQLWATHNGGTAWHRVSLPGSVADLETAAGVVYAASESHAMLTIYRSPAGSDSWTRVAGLPTVHAGGGLGTITVHGTVAWIILGPHVYSTRTGSGWVREQVRCPHEYAISSVGAFSAQRVTLLCSGQPGLGSTPKALLSSSDGGVHYARAGTPPPGGDAGFLAQPGTSHVFIATSSGATWLYASTDGGRRWHINVQLDDGGKGWSDFGFTTATQGVAVEGTPVLGSHLYITRNAGRTWHKVTF